MIDTSPVSTKSLDRGECRLCPCQSPAAYVLAEQGEVREDCPNLTLLVESDDVNRAVFEKLEIHVTSRAERWLGPRPLGGDASELPALVQSGRVQLYRNKPRRVLGGTPPVVPEEPPPVAPPPLTTKLTWIEVQLLDHDGKPMKGEKYSIRLTDGRVMRGELDERGKVRFDDIPDGLCGISFPELSVALPGTGKTSK